MSEGGPSDKSYSKAFAQKTFASGIAMMLEIAGTTPQEFASKVYLEIEGARDVLPYRFPKFGADIVTRWQQGVLLDNDRVFLPYVGRVLAKTNDSAAVKRLRSPSSDEFNELSDFFSRDNWRGQLPEEITLRMNNIKRRQEIAFEWGYLADLIRVAIKDSGLSEEEFASRYGIKSNRLQLLIHGALVVDEAEMMVVRAILNPENDRDTFGLLGTLRQMDSERCEALQGLKDEFAQILKSSMERHKLDIEELAYRANLFPCYIKAYLTGKLVPSERIIDNLAAVIFPDNKTEAILAAHNSRALIIKEVQDSARGRFATLFNVLCDVDTHTYFYDVMNRLVSNRYEWAGRIRFDYLEKESGQTQEQLAILKTKAKAAKAEGNYWNYNKLSESKVILAKVCNAMSKWGTNVGGHEFEELLLAVPSRQVARRPLGRILDEYIAGFAAPNEASFTGFFKRVAHEWELDMERLLRDLEIKVDIDDPIRMQPDFLRDFAKKHGMTRLQTHDLVGLRTRTLALGSVSEIIASAQQLLAGTGHLNNYPANVMGGYLIDNDLALVNNRYDKIKLPNFVLAMLLERTGYKITPLLDYVGVHVFHPDRAQILKGNEGFLITVSPQKVTYMVKKAERAARFFTDDPSEIRSLGLVFLGVGKELTPENFAAHAKSGDLTMPVLIRAIRLQMFKDTNEFDILLCGKGETKKTSMLENSRIKTLNSDEVARLISALKDMYGDDGSHYKVLENFMLGKAFVKEEDCAEFRRKVRFTHQNPTSADAMNSAQCIMNMKDLLHATVPDFVKMVGEMGKCGTPSLATYNLTWAKGAAVKKLVHQNGIRELAINKLGFTQDEADMLTCIMTHKLGKGVDRR